jgi:hypothetical protein
MCLVVVAWNKRGGRPLVLERGLRTRMWRIGEARGAGGPATHAGHKPRMHGTGTRGRSLKRGGGSGDEFVSGRAPRAARKVRWSAPPVTFAVAPAVLRRPQGRRPPDTGTTPRSARQLPLPAVLATGRCAWASGRIIVTIDGTGSPLARARAATAVIAP